ncbi:MAG: phosphatase PAP2 family protein [Clostridia bacterium]|jgi:undecaprenyl-diphosphatase
MKKVREKEEIMKENVIKFIKNNWRWMLLFICLIGFLALAEDVFHQEIMNGDIVGYDIVSKLFKFNVSTPIAKFMTNFGGAIFVISLTTILFFVIKDKKIGISIITNLGIVTILNQIIKFIMQRPRPTEFRIIEETGYSFPSGHSMVSLAFYGYLIYLIYKYINNKHLKRTLIIILSVLICIIGVSRIYLGVHYTSDVLGGFLISFAYLIIYIELVNKFVLEKNKDDRKE